MICILCSIVLEQSKRNDENIPFFQNVIQFNVIEVCHASEECTVSFFRIESRGATRYFSTFSMPTIEIKRQ
jgi:hypothetical protein